MNNQSIYSAFERMWQHIIGKFADADSVQISLDNKADANHIQSIDKGGTGYTSITDTKYTTARYRASSLHSTETNPSVNGVIAWTYE